MPRTDGPFNIGNLHDKDEFELYEDEDKNPHREGYLNTGFMLELKDLMC